MSEKRSEEMDAAAIASVDSRRLRDEERQRPTAAPGAMAGGPEGQLVVGPPLALQQFLYILVRDHLPFGVVEEILLHHVENTKGKTVSFSEPRMAAYAASLAARLK